MSIVSQYEQVPKTEKPLFSREKPGFLRFPGQKSAM